MIGWVSGSLCGIVCVLGCLSMPLAAIMWGVGLTRKS